MYIKSLSLLIEFLEHTYGRSLYSLHFVVESITFLGFEYDTLHTRWSMFSTTCDIGDQFLERERAFHLDHSHEFICIFGAGLLSMATRQSASIGGGPVCNSHIRKATKLSWIHNS